MNYKNFVELKSVGCWFNKEDGMTYAACNDGGWDELSGIHIDDIENPEWFDGLSSKDKDFIDSLFDANYWEMKAELHNGI